MKMITLIFVALSFLIYPMVSIACSPLDLSLAQVFLKSRQKLFDDKVITRFELNQTKLTSLFFQNCGGNLSHKDFCAEATPLADEISQSMKNALDQGFHPHAPLQKLELILKVRTQCAGS